MAVGLTDPLIDAAIRPVGLPIGCDPTPYETARCPDMTGGEWRKRVIAAQCANLAEDGDDGLVFPASNSWELERVQKEWPEVSFSAVRERIRSAEAL